MAEIQLQNGMVALVDDEDLPLVQGYSWYAKKDKHTWYAHARHPESKNGVFMHRLIIGLTPGFVPDHKNGNGLDNRRANLRIVTFAQNAQNARKPTNGTSSRYKGVRWHTATGKWEASIRVNGKRLHLGLFENEDDAAMAYDLAAQEYFGEYARLNKAQDNVNLVDLLEDYRKLAAAAEGIVGIEQVAGSPCQICQRWLDHAEGCGYVRLQAALAAYRGGKETPDAHH